ncbi:MAG: hypothetical protein WC325_10310 [Candidatus Bathyarchaeia archaeon]
MNAETSELLASIAVNIAELKLLEADAKTLTEKKAEIVRFFKAKQDFQQKAIV